MNKKWHKHFGVYGVCCKEQKILVVIKRGGPYDSLYDLPGGSFKENEGLSQCLKREYLEETNSQVEIIKNIGCYDFLLNAEYNGCKYTHHIAQFYVVNILANNKKPLKRFLKNTNYNEENDSMGYKWVDIKLINKNNSSPLVIKAIELLCNDKTNCEIEDLRKTFGVK